MLFSTSNYRWDIFGENPFSKGQMVTKDNASSGRPGWGANLTGTDPDSPTIAFDVDSGGFRHDEAAPANDNTRYQHVVLQRKGDHVESWLNGRLVSTKSGGDNVNVSAPGYAFAVGARGVLSDGTGGKYGLDGRIDELWVFSNALTQDQINTLIARNEASGSRSSLVAHYTFDDTLKDFGANGLHLAAVGGVSENHIRTYTLKEKATGSPVLVYWLAVPMETYFTAGTIRISLPEDTIDQPVLVDLLDGRVYEIEPVQRQGAAVFEGLPIADSPLVLCSRRLLEVMPPGGEQ